MGLSEDFSLSPVIDKSMCIVYTLILIAEKWIAGCAIDAGCESDKQKKNERAGRDKDKDKDNDKGKC